MYAKNAKIPTTATKEPEQEYGLSMDFPGVVDTPTKSYFVLFLKSRLFVLLPKQKKLKSNPNHYNGSLLSLLMPYTDCYNVKKQLFLVYN